MEMQSGHGTCNKDIHATLARTYCTAWKRKTGSEKKRKIGSEIKRNNVFTFPLRSETKIWKQYGSYMKQKEA
jgi:hypothetical protein